MASRFVTTFRKRAPAWLTSGEGGLVMTSLGLVFDAMVERARQGLQARFPSRAPVDALPYIGRDRRIVRGINESTESYSARLIDWLDDWRTAGNPYALMRQLRGYCNVDLRIRTVDNRGNWYTLEEDGTRSVELNLGNWDWDSETNASAADHWSRFWVILYPPTALWETDGFWDDPGVWDDGYTWDTTATEAQVRSVRQIVRDWKPAGTRCVSIIVCFDAAAFDPGDPGPDGFWGLWGKYEAWVVVPSRFADASYWDGTS